MVLPSRPTGFMPPPQGYEDWLRHKADNAMNQCAVHFIQHGKLVRKQSRKLRVSTCLRAPVAPCLQVGVLPLPQALLTAGKHLTLFFTFIFICSFLKF